MLRRLAYQFETSSAAYAAANGIERDPDWFLLNLQEEVGELTQAWNRLTGRGRRRERLYRDRKERPAPRLPADGGGQQIL
ncbi:hypothetical protein ACC713_37010, partial [Rhizobium johnstonii]